MKIRKMLLFSISFSVSISFFSIIRVIELKKKLINFLFIAVIYFRYTYLNYIIFKNLLLLPRILKLIEDMVDDSTP